MNCDIATAAQIISTSPKPLILVDTCSLLDLIRAPVRDKLNADHIKGGIDILGKVTAGELHLVVTSTIQKKFSEHLNATCDELEKNAKSLEEKTAHYIRASGLAGLLLSTAGSLQAATLSKKLSQYSTDLLAQSLILDRDRECDHRALDRVEVHNAPAGRGKSESKDCLIVEHFLELVRQLRRAGYSGKTVFVTNNFNDYGPPSAPRSPLDSEFVGAKIVYCDNFSWALIEAMKS